MHLKLNLAKFLSQLRKILSGFHKCKNFLIKKGTSKGKNLCSTLLKFFNSLAARFPELKVVVVIKNFKLLFLILIDL